MLASAVISWLCFVYFGIKNLLANFRFRRYYPGEYDSQKNGELKGMSTAYHSKYWAHALTLVGDAGTIETLSRSISNARVDLNSSTKQFFNPKIIKEFDKHYTVRKQKVE